MARLGALCTLLLSGYEMRILFPSRLGGIQVISGGALFGELLRVFGETDVNTILPRRDITTQHTDFREARLDDGRTLDVDIIQALLGQFRQTTSQTKPGIKDSLISVWKGHATDI